MHLHGLLAMHHFREINPEFGIVPHPGTRRGQNGRQGRNWHEILFIYEAQLPLVQWVARGTDTERVENGVSLRIGVADVAGPPSPRLCIINHRRQLSLGTVRAKNE